MPHVPRNKSVDVDVDASDVTYDPSNEGDYDGQDPGNVDDALDFLADCCSTNSDLLDELLPSSAPNISSMSASTGVSGNLSFGTSASSNPAGYTLHPTLDVGDTFSTSSPERGIIAASDNISGTLADNVAADSNGSHPADAFGPGDEGTLKLVVNGSTVHSVDLSTFGSGDTKTNGSGFNLSASTAVQFSNGNTLASRQYRTGTWIVDSQHVRTGYNTVKVEHDTSSGTHSTQTYEYIQDDDTTATSITNQEFVSLSTSGSKYISGVEYNTNASATFRADIDNAYRNTFSNSGSAVSYPNSDNCSINGQSLPNPGSYQETLTDFGQTATLNASRVITNLTNFDGFRARTRGLRTVQSTQTASFVEAFNLLIDTVSDDATDLNENFNGENFRLASDSDFDSDLSSNWDEQQSLVGADVGHNSGLQVINSSLIYPSLDFTVATDGPAGNPDYSSASGTRYWFRYFTNSTGAANFRLTLSGNATVISEDSSFTGGSHTEVKISIKFPEGDGEGTGWLDITKSFTPGSWSDGDGCFASTFGNDTTIPTSNWGISIGTRNSANAFDKMYVRVTTNDNFNGELTRFGVDWAVT